MIVTALKSFDHNGRINKGQVFDCHELTARDLKRAKLVALEEPVNFPMAEVSPPSALPPALALPQTTAKLSEDGDTTKPKNKPGRPRKSLL